MNILIVEDDPHQRQDIVATIRKEFVTARVEEMWTEKQVLRAFVADPPLAPDVVILDCMLPWTDPDDVEEDDPPGPYYRAGVRLAALVRSRWPEAVAILYSVLDEFDLADEDGERLPAGVPHVVKGEAFGNLVEAIRARAGAL